MGILLAFAPFIGFALVDRLVGPTQGLFAGAVVAAALLARDLATPRRTPKILEVGTALLFGGLALYAALAEPTWSVIGVRLRVDAGLLRLGQRQDLPGKAQRRVRRKRVGVFDERQELQHVGTLR